MFKNISVKKARKISSIISIFVVIAYLIFVIVNRITNPNNAVFEEAKAISIVGLYVFLPIFFGFFSKYFIYYQIFGGMHIERKENSLYYIYSFLSKEEFRKINLKSDRNKFMVLSIKESPISYYAKLKSDTEIEISIHKNEEEISTEIIDIQQFETFFTD